MTNKFDKNRKSALHNDLLSTFEHTIFLNTYDDIPL